MSDVQNCIENGDHLISQKPAYDSVKLNSSTQSIYLYWY